MASETRTGRCEMWRDGKGFGFLRSDGAPAGEKDIFVHYSQVARQAGEQFVSLQVGDPVRFEVLTTPDGRRQAINVVRTGPADFTRFRSEGMRDVTRD